MDSTKRSATTLAFLLVLAASLAGAAERYPAPMSPLRPLPLDLSEAPRAAALSAGLLSPESLLASPRTSTRTGRRS
jgi:hypothetical protein